MRTGPGVQLLQGVHHRGRDVPGGRAAGDEPDQGSQAAAHAELVGVEAEYYVIYCHIPRAASASLEKSMAGVKAPDSKLDLFI